jgi:hypothetical protein
MKRSKLWLRLILPVLVLLLNGASNGSDASPSYKGHRREIQYGGDNKHSRALRSSTVSQQSSPNLTPTESFHYTYNYYYPSPDTWLTVIGQIATISKDGTIRASE